MTGGEGDADTAWLRVGFNAASMTLADTTAAAATVNLGGGAATAATKDAVAVTATEDAAHGCC